MAPIEPQASSAVYSFPPSLTAIVFSLIDDGCSDENSSKTMRRSVTLSSFFADGIRHCRAALPNRLVVAGRGVLRGLMLDLGIQFRSYKNDNR